MKQELKPSWSAEQQAAGERLRQVWEEAFSAAETGADTAAQRFLGPTEGPRIAEIQARHEAALLRYPHVVGVAEGIRMTRGKPTGERCLVVYVDQKIPRSRLRKGELLPTDIEGVPVDVVEIGRVEPLPGRSS